VCLTHCARIWPAERLRLLALGDTSRGRTERKAAGAGAAQRRNAIDARARDFDTGGTAPEGRWPASAKPPRRPAKPGYGLHRHYDVGVGGTDPRSDLSCGKNGLRELPWD